jgi:hypothetical protein
MNNFGMLFLRKAFIINVERTMYPIINQNIAKQCKPTSSIFHLPSSITDLTGGFL